jgi:hypothetical protein
MVQCTAIEESPSRIQVKAILNRSRIRKSKGYSAKDMLFDILILPFMWKIYIMTLSMVLIRHIEKTLYMNS